MDGCVGGWMQREDRMDGWQIGEQTFHLLLLPEVGHQADRQSSCNYWWQQPPSEDIVLILGC